MFLLQSISVEHVHVERRTNQSAAERLNDRLIAMTSPYYTSLTRLKAIFSSTGGCEEVLGLNTHAQRHAQNDHLMDLNMKNEPQQTFLNHEATAMLSLNFRILFEHAT